MSRQIPDLSIVALAALYRSGAARPTDVVNAIYDEIESAPLQPVWITLVPRAEAVARASGLQANETPLFGIPFAVKDNIDVAGLETTAGCPAFAYEAKTSAFVVDRLLEAGAILIGKTNLDQFATGLVGTRSPYGANSSVFSKEHISGGSSSGSAVAVASGLVSFALGTDTAGSGRIPAAFNNVIGLKPTRGLLSTTGVVPACRSLDCVSVLALTAADAASVFAVVRRFDPSDAYSRQWPATRAPIPELARVGIPKRGQWEFFGDSESERLFRETIDFVASRGFAITEIDFAPFRRTAELLYSGPYVAERFAAVGEFVKSHRDEVNPVVFAIIAGAERFTAVQAYRAEYELKACSAETSRIWAEIDLLLLPSAPTMYTIEQIRHDPIQLNSNLGYYTNFVNLLDLSAVAVPAGFTSASLPFSVTVVAPAFSEYLLLEFADRIQRERVPFAGLHAGTISTVPFKAPAGLSGWVSIGVVGAHLSGQPLNYQLTQRGGRLLGTTSTAADYKFFALTNTKPIKPGLVRVPGFAGPGIEIEIWSIPEREFGSFVAGVPTPLSIGSCKLENGEVVKGFLCESFATSGMPEITHFASWRKYLVGAKC